MKITEMTTDEIMAERRRDEEIVAGCRYQSPQEIADLFEAYTMLIWKHKQVGLVYQFYNDTIEVQKSGCESQSGADKVVKDTLAMLAEFPDLTCEFCDIHCTGDAENGFRFGQVLYNEASTAEGIGPDGPCVPRETVPYEFLAMCECWVRFANGKWRLVDEASIRSACCVRRLRGREV